MSGDSSEEGTQTLLREGGAYRPKLRSRKIRVELVDGPDAGRVIERPGPDVRVGTARTCNLILTDPTVSRHHMTIRVEGDVVRVLDAGSRNGTLVDGLQIIEAYARPDSAIRIGGTTLKLRLLSDMVEIPISNRDSFGAILGSSVAMRLLYSVLERVSPTDATVLIEGETGTGKELAAEAIHDESLRASGPFIVFDCSAVSANLIESELFGHVKGSFTGAIADRLGAFESAHRGTLFLDEIGELPLELQPKLLRALERLEVRRVGSNEVRKVDVRVVAATNRDLAQEVERGAFREDLYYRLAVVRTSLPPLRERADDIPMLVDHFARQLASRIGGDGKLPPEVVAQFSAQAWPGNVRELRNSVARALSVGSTTLDTPIPPSELADQPEAMQINLAVPLKSARDQLVEDFERRYILAALAETGGNVTRAAELAGVHRKFIHRAIRRYDLRGDDE